MQTKKLALGIDLGGTKTRLGIINAAGHVIKAKTIPTKVDGGPEVIIADLLAAIKPLQRKHLVSAIGVAVAGQVNGNTGVVKFAPNLYWRNISLGDGLQETLHIPVTIANDVRAATYAEHKFGAGKNCQDLICIFIGTGIGGGIVANNLLLNGNNNSAGEIGHMVIKLGGDLCTCGNRGCWESIAGGWGIAKNTQNAILSNPLKAQKILSKCGHRADQITAIHLFAAAKEGDRFAKTLVKDIVEALIIGTTNLVNIFNPEMVILGGGIIAGNPDILAKIKKGVRSHALQSATEKLKILPAKTAGDAAVIGIATMALQKWEENGN